MHIHLALPQDVPHIVRLGKELLTFHISLDKHYYQLEENFDYLFTNWISTHINHPSQFIFVATDNNGLIVGFISGFIKQLYPWFRIKKVGHIAYLMIDTPYQRKGIGRLLENEAYLWFKNKNVPYIEVYTDYSNDIGKKAWEKYGYLDFKKFLRKQIAS
jgi:ribosomal protein S18 acetylase RimI-like enzyme